MHSIFIIASIISFCVLLILQIICQLTTGWDEERQRRKFLVVAAIAILPSLIMIAGGVWNYFYPFTIEESMYCILTVCLAAGVGVLEGVHIWCLRKESSPKWKWCRRCLACAAIMIPAAVSLALILPLVPETNASYQPTGIGNTADVSNTEQLVCMSIEIFSVTGLLLMVNLLVVGLFGYNGTRRSWQALRDRMKGRKTTFVRVSMAKDAFLVAAKTIMSVISLSFFMFVNALYSVGMGIARFYALKMYQQNEKEQIKSYRKVGFIITTASLCYIIYSIRLLFGGSAGEYRMEIALMIALYTFVEFGINIKEAIRLRHSHELEAKALRAISFAATLLCFVLTQTAIMSFASEGDTRVSDALAGIIFGSCAASVGIYVVIGSYFRRGTGEQQV